MVRRPKSVTNIAIPNGISAIGHVKTFSGALLKAVKRGKTSKLLCRNRVFSLNITNFARSKARVVSHEPHSAFLSTPIKSQALKKIRYYLLALVAAVALPGCTEYQRILKSTDTDAKLEFARKAFDEKRYVQASTVLSDIAMQIRGSEKAEDALYLLALSYYESKDYLNSGVCFKQYYQRYPRGKYTELARFYSGYGYYLESPDPQLDPVGHHEGHRGAPGLHRLFSPV